MVKNVVLIMATVVVLGALFVALRPDSQGAGPQERVVEVSIRDGVMEPAEIPASEGDRVTLRIDSDAAAELHVHGYDLTTEVEPGETAELSFDADLAGRFEVENHLADSHGDSHGGHSHGGSVLIVEPR